MVIGIAGLTCAGKSTVAGWLERNGAAVASFRRFFESQMCTTSRPTRAELEVFSASYRAAHGPTAALAQMMGSITNARLVVVDGVRIPIVAEWLEDWSSGQYVGVFVKASYSARVARLAARGPGEISPKQLKEYDEMLLRRGLATVLLNYTAFTLDNDSSRESLLRQARASLAPRIGLEWS